MTYGERLVFNSWNETQQNEERERLANIAKLINYYNGDQIQYLKKYIKLSNMDDFPYYSTNITKRIIRKISEVYKEAPTRYIGTSQNDKYNLIVQRKNARMKIAERMANLCGLVGIRPRVAGDYFEYDILRSFSAYFKSDDPLNPYAIKYLLSESNSNKFYEYWDTEQHLILDDNNSEVDPTRFGFTDKVNYYGVIPFVWCHKSEVIDDFYNTGDCADDLIMANEHINLILSEMSHKYRYAAFKPPYIKSGLGGNVDDVMWAYNKVMIITDPDAEVGTLDTDHDFIKDVELLKYNFQMIERNSGLNINWGMDGVPSGRSLIVQNIDHLDDLKNMIEICRTWERDLYEMEQIIAKVDGLNVPNQELTIDFQEVNQPISQEEKNSKWTFEFQNGLSSREDYWRTENPDITDEEIQARLERIANENKTFNQNQKSEPTITDLFNA